MKAKRDEAGRIELEGTPEEIATYYKTMNGLHKKSSTTKRTGERMHGVHRARWSSEERARARQLINKGKSRSQVAKILFKEKLSPFLRTASAISTEFGRMIKDPNRR